MCLIVAVLCSVTPNLTSIPYFTVPNRSNTIPLCVAKFTVVQLSNCSTGRRLCCLQLSSTMIFPIIELISCIHHKNKAYSMAQNIENMWRSDSSVYKTFCKKFTESAAFIQMCNPVLMFSLANFRCAVCQECPQTGATGGDHRNRVRLARLNPNHKVSFIPSGSDPRGCWPHSPWCSGAHCFGLEVKVPLVVIPIIINYHISTIHRCTQLSYKKLSICIQC